MSATASIPAEIGYRRSVALPVRLEEKATYASTTRSSSRYSQRDDPESSPQAAGRTTDAEPSCPVFISV